MKISDLHAALNKVDGPVGNYYGGVGLSYDADKHIFYVYIDDYNDADIKEVSDEFALAWVREFGDKNALKAVSTFMDVIRT